MSLKQFINDAVSPWMKVDGADSDIVLSSRVRLARNLAGYPFPMAASQSSQQDVSDYLQAQIEGRSYRDMGTFEWLSMKELPEVDQRMLVEKHLISPQLIRKTSQGSVFINKDQSMSMMVNEEDHLRIQCLLPGFQINDTLALASGVDDWIEQEIDYAFDEHYGYLTSCPTNVGTGMRASLMVHLPALVMTQQMNRIIPAISQLGLVVRGIYGEGSEAIGHVFQISNQMTLGKSEIDIVKDLRSVVVQLIQQERTARQTMLSSAKMRMTDRVYRAYGILRYSRMIQTKEAAACLSDVRLGIDLGLIEDVSGDVMNELMILTQAGFLQKYAQKPLTYESCDILRASLIRERLEMEKVD